MANQLAVSKMTVVVPTALKRQLQSCLSLRGITFVEWLRGHIERDIVNMGGKLPDNSLDNGLYPLERERVIDSSEQEF